MVIVENEGDTGISRETKGRSLETVGTKSPRKTNRKGQKKNAPQSHFLNIPKTSLLRFSQNKRASCLGQLTSSNDSFSTS